MFKIRAALVLIPSFLRSALATSVVLDSTSVFSIPPEIPDPCAAIAGKVWVSPQDVRACFTSFEVDPDIKANTIDVINKTLAFHASVNYQIQAPEPFASDVHEDLLQDLARIDTQSYPSDFDLHIDLSRTLKRVNDGHCVYINLCYDALYLTYLPIPLVLLTDPHGVQQAHIAPEAFAVASAEFGDQIKVWQDALPGDLKGQLSTLDGAKVLLIDGQDPFVAVNANALITGGYQSFATRQNSFFSSYLSGSAGWNYAMGNFAQQALPLNDNVNLTIQRVNSSAVDTISLPYRSRLISTPFTNSTSYRENHCVATNQTNGYDAYAKDISATLADGSVRPAVHFFQQPQVSAKDMRHPMNVLLDNMPLSNVVLPPTLVPGLPLNESYSVAKFYMLEDGVTGVLALGSFAAPHFTPFQSSLLKGLLALKQAGAQQLIVDATNNGGGYICIAHWLHRIIIGPSANTEPQAGLDSKARAGPLAQLISKHIAAGHDPEALLLYNSGRWTNASHDPFPEDADWLQPTVDTIINGHLDSFSQRLGQECQPFLQPPPDEPLFDAKNVVIISNGRCASSCSLFSITMSKKEGVKTAVVGGKSNVPQQYCGVVGGQSTDFSTIDVEIKTTHLKNNSLAPPDFSTNSIQGITWRLAFGIDDPAEPEEWQDHPADYNMPLTAETVNNPAAIWKEVASKVWAQDAVPVLRVQSDM